MEKPAQFKTKAWLLRGIISSLPGILEFSKGHLSFTACGCGSFWPFQIRALERYVGQPGLAQKLENDQNVLLFDVPLPEVAEVSFPWYSFSYLVKFSVHGVRYRFSLIRPGNTGVLATDMIDDLYQGSGIGEVWEAILLNAPNG